ncbi:MAG: ATP-dependent DNA helicase, partial [Bacteroidales bacterium]|nr:ATP-dependent DNA helicase [Bacteroidales bacterium]
CISHWGNDFRPSYLKICEFIDTLPQRPVISAFTATATQEVKKDIAEILNLRNPFILTTGFNRENLYFDVKKPKNKYEELLKTLNRNPEKICIIYCSTRKNVEEITGKLQNDGFEATRYHAGLSVQERKNNQDDFIYDRKKIIVATNAFGMGIDKSNVSIVIHYNMPKNIESYYQEAGRAGRDGARAECILYFSERDIITVRNFIEQTGENNQELSVEEIAAIQKRDRERLNEMINYCRTAGCFREYILDYFNDREDVKCGNCGNCENKNPIEERDITIDAQKILSCVFRMNQNFGVTRIIEVLRGSKSDRISQLGFDTLTTYGIMKDRPEKEIRDMFNFLIDNEFLLQAGDKYPVIRLTLKSNEILRERKQVLMPYRKDMFEGRDKKTSKEKSKTLNEYGVNEKLLSALKKVRLELATRAKVPAYVIFHDSTLIDMSIRQPENMTELLQIPGVGKSKMDKYGKTFLTCIENFRKGS